MGIISWHCCSLDLWVLLCCGLTEKWPVMFYTCLWMNSWITTENPGCFCACVCIIQCKKWWSLKSGLGRVNKFRSRFECKHLQMWNREGVLIHLFSLTCYWNSNSDQLQQLEMDQNSLGNRKRLDVWLLLQAISLERQQWAHMHQLAYTQPCAHLPLQEQEAEAPCKEVTLLALLMTLVVNIITCNLLLSSALMLGSRILETWKKNPNSVCCMQTFRY